MCPLPAVVVRASLNPPPRAARAPSTAWRPCRPALHWHRRSAAPLSSSATARRPALAPPALVGPPLRVGAAARQSLGLGPDAASTPRRRWLTTWRERTIRKPDLCGLWQGQRSLPVGRPATRCGCLLPATKRATCYRHQLAEHSLRMIRRSASTLRRGLGQGRARRMVTCLG